MSASITAHSGPLDSSSSIAELLAGAQRRDPRAWNEIVRRYQRAVTAKVRSFGLQEADALDATQMTWLQLAENCHQIRRPESLGGWLATTASRESLHILRRGKRATPGLPESTAQMADPSVGPEDRAVRAETVRAVQRSVAQLAPERRRLLSSLFAEDPPSYADLARSSGMPIGSIGPTRARTLQQLRHSLEDCGLAPPPGHP
jgi:RNA polymerase sigma factor (sigma-70 family)